jgi:hypothetical protein
MVDRVIEFARARTTLKAPCYSLVSAWLRANGIPGVPRDSVARRWWLQDGPERGARRAAAAIGLIERSPQPGDVAVVAQEDGEPLLAIVTSQGLCVVRAFGRLSVGRANVIVSWGFPWDV